MQQYAENGSDRNCRMTSSEKGVRWAPEFQKVEDTSGTTAESLMMPKSGIRRTSVHFNVFNESHTAIHAGVAKSRVRNRWHKVKRFLGKQRSEEFPSVGNNNCCSWDCIDDSYSKNEKTDEPICLEECFRRSAAVTAFAEEASSDSSITFVSRSFEVNPKAGNHWSTLKDAISSGRIFEELKEEDEKSGLRRVSLAPTKSKEAKAPNASQDPHSGWFKIKTLLGREAPSHSSKYDVTCTGNNSISGNEIDDCVGKDAPDMLESNRDEEFYAVIDSSVQALPSEVVSNTEVVSVTRSFEYHGNWQKVRSMLKEQDRSQEQKVFAPGEKNQSGSSEVKIDCLENALLKKNVYCQTEFDLGEAFQQKILKNLVCGFCGSKYEERDTTTSKDKVNQNETGLSDDEVGSKSLLQQGEKRSAWEKMIKPEKDTCKECDTTSCGKKLVEDMLQNEQLTIKLQERGDREVNEALRNYRFERKGHLPVSKKTYLGFCEGSSLVAFDNDNNSFDEEIMKHEREECQTNKGFIAGNVDGVVGRAFDDGGLDNKKRWKDRQDDTKFPEYENIGAVIEDHKAIASDQKAEEETDVILTSNNQEVKNVISRNNLLMSTLTERTDNSSKEGQGPRIPVMVTSKVFECEKPFVISYV